MWNCTNCGNVNEGEFCTSCGNKKLENQPELNYIPNVNQQYNMQQPYNMRSKQGKKKGFLITIVILLSIIAITAIGALIYVIVNNVSKGSEEAVIAYPPIEEPFVEKEDIIENTLEVLAGSDRDISIAIIDNKTNEEYESESAEQRYEAWGFYLPVYMVYGNYSYARTNVLENIMSSNATVCNNAANEAIDDIGGLLALNNDLDYKFDCDDTIYGRLFGDVNSVNGNYTTAEEAVKLVHLFAKKNPVNLLSYNTQTYGIYAPSGASMYAQAGTESLNKKDNLNLYAVVKGNYSDYSVVILTRNGAGKNHNISNILSGIHEKMEEISR